MTLDLNNTKIERDEEGYLMQPELWNPEIAEALAREENLVLNEECWSIINFMRHYFEEHQVSPDTRFAIKHLANELGYGKQARNHLFTLFPYGYVKQACKIAGMRHPRAWSTG